MVVYNVKINMFAKNVLNNKDIFYIQTNVSIAFALKDIINLYSKMNAYKTVLIY